MRKTAPTSNATSMFMLAVRIHGWITLIASAAMSKVAGWMLRVLLSSRPVTSRSSTIKDTSCACSAIRETSSSTSSIGTVPDRGTSARPSTAVSGVRSSWETDAMKASLARIVSSSVAVANSSSVMSQCFRGRSRRPDLPGVAPKL